MARKRPAQPSGGGAYRRDERRDDHDEGEPLGAGDSLLRRQSCGDGARSPLIEGRQYVLQSGRGGVHPKDADENAYLESHAGRSTRSGKTQDALWLVW
jgi:hypothetical protein